MREDLAPEFGVLFRVTGGPAFGKIYLSDEATRRARMERQSRTVTFEVSGVTLTARHL